MSMCAVGAWRPAWVSLIPFSTAVSSMRVLRAKLARTVMVFVIMYSSPIATPNEEATESTS
eukprot:8304476-Heterocapsa_arctica.AAC.1